MGVELSCSDATVHRERVEGRELDIPGLAKPNWQEVVSRDYSPWIEADLKIDAATASVDDAVSAIMGRL